MPDIDALAGERRRKRDHRQMTGPQEGRVVDVGPAGIRFTIGDLDQHRTVFGPAPWNEHDTGPASAGAAHVHTARQPVAGDRCLAVFVGNGIDRPWILAWWPA